MIPSWLRKAVAVLVMLTTDGLEYQARYTNQETAGAWKWMSTGSGSTAESSAHTALVAENTTLGGERAIATLSYEASYKSVWTRVVSATGNVTIREVGIHNSLTVGGSKMLMRHVFASDKNLENGQTLQITMKLTQSA
jgi:hypothetical protein